MDKLFFLRKGQALLQRTAYGSQPNPCRKPESWDHVTSREKARARLGSQTWHTHAAESLDRSYGPTCYPKNRLLIDLPDKVPDLLPVFLSSDCV
jgi:hypothetical protein